MGSTIKKNHKVTNLPDGSVKLSFKANMLARSKPGFMGIAYIFSILILFMLSGGGLLGESVFGGLFFAACAIALVIRLGKVVRKTTDLVVNDKGINFDRPAVDFSSVFDVNMAQLAFKDISDLRVFAAGMHSSICAEVRGELIHVTGTMSLARARALLDEIMVAAESRVHA